MICKLLSSMLKASFKNTVICTVLLNFLFSYKLSFKCVLPDFSFQQIPLPNVYKIPLFRVISIASRQCPNYIYIQQSENYKSPSISKVLGEHSYPIPCLQKSKLSGGPQQKYSESIIWTCRNTQFSCQHSVQERT